MAGSGSVASELLKPWVRASVIDVRRADPPIDARYLLDTNVLYFLHYDKFDSLQALGEGPRSYQLQYYPRFIKTLRERRAELFVHRLGLLEFAHLVDKSELSVLYAIKTPDIGDTLPGDLNLKNLRKTYAVAYGGCQAKVVTLVESLRKTYLAVPTETREPGAFWAHWCQIWPKSIGGPSDVAQILDAQASGITSVVTDDADWVSCPDISYSPPTSSSSRLLARLGGSLPKIVSGRRCVATND